MKMRKQFKYLMALISIAGLVACATAEKYNAMLNQWVGQSEDALVSNWGAPNNSYQTDTAKYLTYENSRQNVVPSTPPTTQVIRQGEAVFVKPIPGTPGYVYTTECRTTFTIQNKRVVNAYATGNACVL
jgi:hypothetical protein